ncbi:MAG: phosphodiesterase, partial [Solirubrobacterales bacterium]|nr:phosphodiesterase [Solirubrobacterales bacterium]
EAAGLAFDPLVNAGPGLRQSAGALDVVRAMSYRASRAARPAG